jgi:purine-binding chemotaxis protein CheW
MSAEKSAVSNQLLTFSVAGQLFGVPVLQVNDVLKSQKVTCTPLASPSIAGIMNLRGRIVTAVDMRHCLGQPERGADETNMSVVVDQDGELFSLIIDSVGDVLTLTEDTYEQTPVTLAPAWRGVALGIHKLQGKILVILDIKRLLELAENKERVLQ